MTDEKRKIVSVWMILQDGQNQGKAILQKRAGTEKKFPYICQATWAGKVELGETVENAMKRECIEELGQEFADSLDFSKFKLYSKHDFARAEDGAIWESYDYSVGVNENNILSVKMHTMAFPEFIFAKAIDLHPIKENLNPEHNVVLFDDQYEISKQLIK